ncbi:hypothetical protein ACFVZC_20155 [Streptomyces marokkonensis]|uniref:Secreted protein n=1 Tax=Streptomyces marokkonensis TaxID=324855 RepID=A0ABW6Q909_9ACTN|nr:hypothetical protein [Streptomyces marokkonensis]
MRKYQKAAVVMAMLGSVGFLGAGTSFAGDGPEFELDNKQANACSQENTIQGLVNVNDVNVPIAALLGLNNVEDETTNAVNCANGLSLGGK